MGVVIKKLPHPYKLTHKITSKNGKGFFFFFLVCGGFPRNRERGERRENFFLKFSKWFSQNFFIKNSYFSSYFSHKNEGVFIGGWGKWEASWSVTSLPFLLLHQAILSFSCFLVQSSCSCLKAFSNFVFFNLYIPRKL